MKKTGNKKGFTLVELLVVIAIIVMLISLSTIAVFKYRRSLKAVEMDGIAEEIFLAAQNNLSQLQSQGYPGCASFGTQEVVKDNENNTTTQTGIYYYIVKASSFTSDGLGVLDKILPQGSIDETVRTGGNYIIRYQLSTGTVLDVFYSSLSGNLSHEFVYENDYVELTKADSVYRTDRKERSNYGEDRHVIGYYGDEDGVRKTIDGGSLGFPQLKVINAEKLYAIVTLPESVAEGEEVNGTVTIYGQTSEATMVFDLTSPEARNKNVKRIEGDSSVTLPNGTVCPAGSYMILLDDITSQNGFHFLNLFPSFIAGENIEIQVNASVHDSADAVIRSSDSTRVIVNSLFATCDLSTATVTVNNFRHLENLDTDVSGLHTTNLKTGLNTLTVNLISDLVWAVKDDNEAECFINDVSKLDAKINWDIGTTRAVFNYLTTNNTSTIYTVPGTYHPVTPQFNFTFNGNNHKIKGVIIEKWDGDSGLFGNLDNRKCEIKDLALVDFKVDLSEIEGKSAGALAGSARNNQSEISGVIAYNTRLTSDDSALGIVSKSNAGGLIGDCAVKSIDACAAALYVKGDLYAGGLLGKAENVTITNSYSGGHTSAARYAVNFDGEARVNVFGGKYAGGFIGYSNGNDISFSYSTCSAGILGSEAYNAGGFFGFVNGGIVNYTYAAGRVIAAKSGTVYTGGAYYGKEGTTPFKVSEDDSVTEGKNFFLTNVSLDISLHGTDKRVKGLSGKSTTNEMILAKADRGQGLPYDKVLELNYLGNYYFRNIDQMHAYFESGASATTIKEGITDRHYGDWQIPSIDSSYYYFVNGDTLTFVAELESIKTNGRAANMATVSFTGEESGAVRTLLVRLSDRTANKVLDTRVGLYKDGDIYWSDGVDGNVYTNSIKAQIDSTGSYLVITLDDITEFGQHFAELFAADSDELTAIDPDKKYKFIPGENVIAHLIPGMSGWIDLNLTSEAKTNSLFAFEEELAYSGFTTDETAETPVKYLAASITSIRHLQNLEPDVSDVFRNYTDADTKIRATVKSDIAWKTRSLGTDVYTIFNTKITKVYSSHESKTKGFVGIYNPRIELLDGENHTVSHVPFTVGFDGTVNSGAGLFRLIESSCTIKNIKLSECTSNGTYAGILAGRIAVGSGNTVTVDTVLAASESNSTYSVNSNNSVSGGLIGLVDGSGTVVITNSASSLLVKAENGVAGGIVGYINGSDVTIDRSYAAGHTKDAKYILDGFGRIVANIVATGNATETADRGIAGGIVGYAKSGSLNITNYSFSAASVSGDSAAGGLIGKTKAPTELGVVYVIAPVSGVQTTVCGNNMGAIIGVIDTVTVNNRWTDAVSGASKTGTYYLPEIYTEIWSEMPTAAVYGTSLNGGKFASDPVMSFYEMTAGNVNEISVFYGGNAAVRTFICDSAIGGKDFPFIVRTSFTFDFSNTNLGTYYGDWQPIITEATKTHLANIYYVDPLDNKLKSPSNASLATQTIIEGEENRVLVPSIPAFKGYTAVWEIGETEVDISNGYFIIPADITDDNVTIIARYVEDPNACVVTFYIKDNYDSAEDNWTVTDQQSISKNSKMSDIVCPSRSISNYYFDGWFADKAFTQPISFTAGTVTDDIVAYAKYVKISFYHINVNFMYYTTKGGEVSTINTVIPFSIDRVRGMTYNDITLPELGNAFSDPVVKKDNVAVTADVLKGNALHIPEPGENVDSVTYDVIYKYTQNVATELEYQVIFRYRNTASNSWNYSATSYRDVDSGIKGKIRTGSVPVFTIDSSKIQTGFKYPNGSDIEYHTIEANNTKIYVNIYRLKYTVTFDSKSGSYVEPVQLYFGQPLSDAKPAVNPTRTGYSFYQWTLHKLNETSVTYQWTDSMPANHVVVDASWNNGSSTYTVLYWRQKVTDSISLTDNNAKSYDFAGIVTGRSGQTGTRITPQNTDTNKAGSGDYKGFHYSWSKNIDSLSADGTSVLNVYYDRNEMTMVFHGLKDAYKASTDANAAFGKDDRGQYTRLIQKDGKWYYYGDGKTITETDSTSYDGTFYSVSTSSTNNTPTKYGIVNGQLRELTYNTNRREWRYGNGNSYSGTRYTIVDSPAVNSSYYAFIDGEMVSAKLVSKTTDKHFYNSNNQIVYPDTVYNRSGGGMFRDYTYTKASEPYTNGQTYYVRNGSGYYATYSSVTYRESTSYVIEYSTSYTETVLKEYTGTRYVHDHTRTGSSNDTWRISGLYGQPLSMYGYEWPTDNAWYYTGGTGMSYLGQWVFPNDITSTTMDFYSDGSVGAKYAFYLEQADGSYKLDAYGATNGSGNFQFTDKYDGYNVSKYLVSKVSKNGSAPATYSASDVSKWNNARVNNSFSTSSSYYNMIAFSRKTYDLSFYNVTTNTTYRTTTGIKMGVSLAGQGVAPGALPSGFDSEYSWNRKYYADQACTVEFDFSKEVMPSHPLVVYVKFTLPEKTVTFDLRDPNTSTAAAHYLKAAPSIITTNIRTATGNNYAFTLEKMTVLSSVISDNEGNLKPEYTPEKEGYKFLGWYYMDGAQERPFINSQAIQDNITVYAKWESLEQKRKIQLVYKSTTGEKLGEEFFNNGQEYLVGTPVSITVDKDFTDYTCLITSFTWTVLEDNPNVYEVIYSKSNSWSYDVVYKIRLRSYESLESEISDVTLAADGALLLEAARVSYTMDNIATSGTAVFQMPAGYSGYRFYQSSYRGEQSVSQNITVSYTADASQREVVFFIEPDQSSISVDDLYAVYDGQNHAVGDTLSDSTYAVPEGYTSQLRMIYKFFDSNNNATTSLIDAGTYRINAYAVLEITNGTETFNYLIRKENANLRIDRRKITITSASGSQRYNATAFKIQEVLATLDSDPENGQAFVNNDGDLVSYAFTAQSFRLDIGEQENAFTVVYDKEFNPNNYEIKRVFGTLSVYWDYSYETYVRYSSYDEVKNGDIDSIDTTSVDVLVYSSELQEAHTHDVSVAFTFPESLTYSDYENYYRLKYVYDGKEYTLNLDAVNDPDRKDEYSAHIEPLLNEQNEFVDNKFIFIIEPDPEKLSRESVAHSTEKLYDGKSMPSSEMLFAEGAAFAFPIDSNIVSVVPYAQCAYYDRDFNKIPIEKVKDADTYYKHVYITLAVTTYNSETGENETTKYLLWKDTTNRLIHTIRPRNVYLQSDTVTARISPEGYVTGRDYTIKGITDYTFSGTYTYVSDGFIEGEGIVATFIPDSELVIGPQLNKFTYVLDSNTKSQNYDITVLSYGTLTLEWQLKTTFLLTLPGSSAGTIGGHTVEAQDGKYEYSNTINLSSASVKLNVDGLIPEVALREAFKSVFTATGVKLNGKTIGGAETKAFTVSLERHDDGDTVRWGYYDEESGTWSYNSEVVLEMVTKRLDDSRIVDLSKVYDGEPIDHSGISMTDTLADLSEADIHFGTSVLHFVFETVKTFKNGSSDISDDQIKNVGTYTGKVKVIVQVSEDAGSDFETKYYEIDTSSNRTGFGITISKAPVTISSSTETDRYQIVIDPDNKVTASGNFVVTGFVKDEGIEALQLDARNLTVAFLASKLGDRNATDIGVTYTAKSGTDLNNYDITLDGSVHVKREYRVTFVNTTTGVTDPTGLPASFVWNSDNEADGVVPANPTSTSHSVDYWQGSNGIRYYEGSKLPAENITLTLNWKVKTYGVSFESKNTNLGIIVSDEWCNGYTSVPYGSTVAIDNVNHKIGLWYNGTLVRLVTAHANDSANFTGWSVPVGYSITNNAEVIYAEFEIKRFTVEFKGTNCKITAKYGDKTSDSGSIEVDYGTIVTFSVTEDTGYEQPTFDVGGNTRQIDVKEDLTGAKAITAKAKIKKFTVSTQVIGTGKGTVTGQSNDIPYGSIITVNGNKLTITKDGVTVYVIDATPDNSSEFDGWTYGDSGTELETGFEIKDTLHIKASFKIRRVEIKFVIAKPSGSIFGIPSIKSGNDIYTAISGVPYGSIISVSGNEITIRCPDGIKLPTGAQDISFTAVENTGLIFDSWSVTNNYKIESQGPITITAAFNPEMLDLTVNKQNGDENCGYSVVWSNGFSKVPYGSTITVNSKVMTITDTNNDLVVTISASDDGSAQYVFESWNHASAESVQSNLVVTANFVARDYEVSIIANNGSVTANWDPAYENSMSAPYGSIVTTDGDTLTIKYNNKTIVSAVVDPHSNSQFTGWFIGSNEIVSGSTIITGEVNITAKCEVVYYTVSFVATPGSVKKDGNVITSVEVMKGSKASISGGTLNFTYNSDGQSEVVTVVATPDVHYHLSSSAWTGISNNEVINGDKTITAKFDIDQFKVTYSGTSGHCNVTAKKTDGTVVRSGESVDYGTKIVFTVTPATGYKDAKWTGKNTAVFEEEIIGNVNYTADATLIQYTVTFLNNTTGIVEMTTMPSNIIIDYGTTKKVPANPSSTSHIFTGWLGSDGNIYQANSTLTAKNLTLTAQWEIKKYTLSFSLDGYYRTSSISANKVYDVPYGSTIVYASPSLHIKDPDGKIISTVTVDLGSNRYIQSVSVADNSIVTSDESISINIGSGGCITGDTLITLADGTQKMMKDITAGEMVLVFNHETGCLDVAPMGILVHKSEEEAMNRILNLVFDNGTEIKVINHHGFFDKTRNEYVYLNFINVSEYYGHEFYSLNGNVTLVSSYETEEYSKAYAPISMTHLNYFTNSVLAMTSSMDGLFNIFELDDEMKYDQESKERDIAKYGVYDYSDFEQYIPYEVYAYFPAPYFKTSVGKGYITFEHIIELANQYVTDDNQ